MCLRFVNSKPPKKTEGTGFKVFEICGGILHGVCQDTNPCRPVNTWLRASQQGWYSAKVDIGFHIYKDRKSAIPLLAVSTRNGYGKLVLRRVKYKGAHSHGLGDGGWNNKAKVVVASQILIFPKKGDSENTIP